MTHPTKPALRALRRPFDDTQFPPSISQPFGNINDMEPAVYDYHDGIYGWQWETDAVEANTHTGIDYVLDSGTPLLSVADATVHACTPPDESFGFGNLTILDHGGRLYSFYAHQSRFGCMPGQRLKAGEVMGYVGTTGNSTGPHLHFAVGMDDGAGYYDFFSPVPYLLFAVPEVKQMPTAGRYRVLVDMFLRKEPNLNAAHGRFVKAGDYLTAYKGWTTHFRAISPEGEWAWAPNLAAA